MKNNYKLAVILGSGLDAIQKFLDEIKIIKEIPKGVHKKIIYEAKIKNENVLFFSGRKHFYESYPADELVENIEFAVQSNVKNILITNAAGGLNPNFEENDLMLIRSIINFNSKLILSHKYFFSNQSLHQLILDAAKESQIKIHEGVYGFFSGPAYETKAEIKYLLNKGIDAAGMSTLPEMKHAFAKKINVAGLSVITNLLRENSLHQHDHNIVVANATKASGGLFKLLSALILELK